MLLGVASETLEVSALGRVCFLLPSSRTDSLLLLLAIGSTDKRTDTHTYNAHAHTHRLETLSNTLSSSMARGRDVPEAEKGRRHKTSQKRSSQPPWTTRKVVRRAIRTAPRSRFPVPDPRKFATRPRPHTPHSKINRKWQNPKITALAKLVPRNGNLPPEPETRSFLKNHARP